MVMQCIYIVYGKQSKDKTDPYRVFFPNAKTHPDIYGTTFESAQKKSLDFILSEESTGILQNINPKTVLKTLGSRLSVPHVHSDPMVYNATLFDVNKGTQTTYGPLYTENMCMKSSDWEHDNATKRFLGFIKDPTVIDDYAKQVIIVDFINAWQDLISVTNILLNEILDIDIKDSRYLDFVNTGADLIRVPWEEDNIFTYFLWLAKRKTDTESEKTPLKRIAHIVNIIKEIDKITNKQSELLHLLTWKLEFFESGCVARRRNVLREIRYAINNGYPMPQKRR